RETAAGAGEVRIGEAPPHARLLACGFGGLGLRVARVLLVKSLDAARGVDQPLPAGEERVALRADFHADVALVRRAGMELVAARADDADFVISGVNPGLHVETNPFSSF